MLNKLSLAAPAFLILVSSGCGHGSDEAIAKQVTHLGVYSLTTTGLLEITQYGVTTFDPISQEINFKFDQPIAQAAVPLGFVTNIPNAVIAEAKVFLLPSIEAGRWHRHFVDAGDSKPIPSSAEAISGSIYKVTPSALPDPAAGFLCLWVKMPAGTEDRVYAIHLK